MLIETIVIFVWVVGIVIIVIWLCCFWFLVFVMLGTWIVCSMFMLSSLLRLLIMCAMLCRVRWVILISCIVRLFGLRCSMLFAVCCSWLLC